MANEFYDTVFVDGQGFIELTEADKLWLKKRQEARKEHEFLAKTGVGKDSTKTKWSTTDGKNTFRNFVDF